MAAHEARGGTLILSGGFAGSGRRNAAGFRSTRPSGLPAKNIRSKARPNRYRMLGEVATLGRYKGVADVLRIRFRGFLGWWVTRTYHLHELPLLSRKLRVVTDWTVALLFRRDTVQLGTLGHPGRIGDG